VGREWAADAPRNELKRGANGLETKRARIGDPIQVRAAVRARPRSDGIIKEQPEAAHIPGGLWQPYRRAAALAFHLGGPRDPKLCGAQAGTQVPFSSILRLRHLRIEHGCRRTRGELLRCGPHKLGGNTAWRRGPHQARQPQTKGGRTRWRGLRPGAETMFTMSGGSMPALRRGRCMRTRRCVVDVRHEQTPGSLAARPGQALADPGSRGSRRPRGDPTA